MVGPLGEPYGGAGGDGLVHQEGAHGDRRAHVAKGLEKPVDIKISTIRSHKSKYNLYCHCSYLLYALGLTLPVSTSSSFILLATASASSFDIWGRITYTYDVRSHQM